MHSPPEVVIPSIYGEAFLISFNNSSMSISIILGEELLIDKDYDWLRNKIEMINE